MITVELVKSGDALSLRLACDGDNDGSNTVHRMADALSNLTRWHWQTSGSHTLLCRGDAVFAQVWQHDASEWRMRWIPSGRVEPEIISFELAKDMAIQAARSKGKLGAGEVVA